MTLIICIEEPDEAHSQLSCRILFMGLFERACLFRSGHKNNQRAKNNIRREFKRLKVDMVK